MIDRREVLAAGLTVSLLTCTKAVGAAGAAPRPTPLFVADERFAEARAAASAAARKGAAVHAISDDLTALYDRLDRAWREHPFPVAGLTTSSALFVIERLAADRGSRTVYRGIHRRGADGRLVHEASGAPTVPAEVLATAGWTEALGMSLVDFPLAATSLEPLPMLAPPGPDGSVLVSWLLAPRRGGTAF
ncbi:MAG: hypothetical protein C0P79_002260 [Gammaproteobacteria bacterium]